ncbi:hypothetical protein CQW23_05096 [Capsicum baccatum]|uniref:Uncharacterized protein n=1 Tax=Capsicum baccatum TaxID=33114 RepID=A0A2G2XGK3_CAPBA|nr:hypothetical protein CQW23_05096 [Capsicum baccatum]
MMDSVDNRAAGRDESVSIEGLEHEALVDGSMVLSSGGLEATLNSLIGYRIVYSEIASLPHEATSPLR